MSDPKPTASVSLWSGPGVIGKRHGQVIASLADRIELVAVVDVHPERAEQLAAEHGGRRIPV